MLLKFNHNKSSYQRTTSCSHELTVELMCLRRSAVDVTLQMTKVKNVNQLNWTSRCFSVTLRTVDELHKVNKELKKKFL